MRLISTVLFLLASSMVQTTQGNANAFVLDSTKPYVYIAFDHAGSRAPIFAGESPEGLWLRFVNNCRLPVVIGTFDPGTGEKGIGVLYDVVAIPSSGSGGIPSLPGDKERAREQAPEGYSSTASAYSTMTVAPGKSVLFSIPKNHLARNWFIRVQFTLDVGEARGDQPYSYADFRWEQLPASITRRHR
jgi:hypothetical protein